MGHRPVLFESMLNMANVSLNNFIIQHSPSMQMPNPNALTDGTRTHNY